MHSATEKKDLKNSSLNTFNCFVFIVETESVSCKTESEF